MKAAKPKGIFVTFEGTEGAGKSTLIRNVAQFLTPMVKYPILLTREPGGSPCSEKIRNIILEAPMDPMAELFLYEAARAEHVAGKIRPALEQGGIVLCDRFADSSLAYQAHARGLPWKTVKALNEIAIQGVRPDLTVLLDIDPALGLRRAREHNRFEDEGVEFQRRVRQGFLKARREDPKRWFTVPVAKNSPEQLTVRVAQEFLRRFRARGVLHG